MANVQTPVILIRFEREDADGADSEEADSYTKSFNTSSICNSVAELGQLTYQAGFGTRNKQSLPPELRKFDVREGAKFVLRPNDEEYISFYLTLLSFGSSAEAEGFASEIKAAVEPCGDVSGDVTTRNTLRFEELEGENNFAHGAREVLEFASLDVTFVSESIDYLIQRGAVVGLVHVGASENGVRDSGMSRQEIDEAAVEILDQAFSGIEY